MYLRQRSAEVVPAWGSARFSYVRGWFRSVFFFFQAEDGIRDLTVTGVQTCALPISRELDPVDAGQHDVHHGEIDVSFEQTRQAVGPGKRNVGLVAFAVEAVREEVRRSEEHTSELQSQSNIVCRLLLAKKKNI